MEDAFSIFFVPAPYGGALCDVESYCTTTLPTAPFYTTALLTHSLTHSLSFYCRPSIYFVSHAAAVQFDWLPPLRWRQHVRCFSTPHEMDVRNTHPSWLACLNHNLPPSSTAQPAIHTHTPSRRTSANNSCECPTRRPRRSAFTAALGSVYSNSNPAML